MENTKKAMPFKVWRSVTIGTYDNPFALGNVIEGLRYLTIPPTHPSDTIDLGEIAINKMMEKIDLVMVTPAELGFEENPTFSDICKRLEDFGLQPCPQETGFQLALQYDGPSDDAVYRQYPFVGTIPMNSIYLNSQEVKLFVSFFLDHHGKLIFSTKDIQPSYTWILPQAMIFQVKK